MKNLESSNKSNPIKHFEFELTEKGAHAKLQLRNLYNQNVSVELAYGNIVVKYLSYDWIQNQDGLQLKLSSRMDSIATPLNHANYDLNWEVNNNEISVSLERGQNSSHPFPLKGYQKQFFETEKNSYGNAS